MGFFRIQREDKTAFSSATGTSYEVTSVVYSPERNALGFGMLIAVDLDFKNALELGASEIDLRLHKSKSTALTPGNIIRTYDTELAEDQLRDISQTNVGRRPATINLEQSSTSLNSAMRNQSLAMLEESERNNPATRMSVTVTQAEERILSLLEGRDLMGRSRSLLAGALEDQFNRILSNNNIDPANWAEIAEDQNLLASLSDDVMAIIGAMALQSLENNPTQGVPLELTRVIWRTPPRTIILEASFWIRHQNGPSSQDTTDSIYIPSDTEPYAEFSLTGPYGQIGRPVIIETFGFELAQNLLIQEAGNVLARTSRNAVTVGSFVAQQLPWAHAESPVQIPADAEPLNIEISNNTNIPFWCDIILIAPGKVNAVLNDDFMGLQDMMVPLGIHVSRSGDGMNDLAIQIIRKYIRNGQDNRLGPGANINLFEVFLQLSQQAFDISEAHRGQWNADTHSYFLRLINTMMSVRPGEFIHWWIIVRNPLDHEHNIRPDALFQISGEHHHSAAASPGGGNEGGAGGAGAGAGGGNGNGEPEWLPGVKNTIQITHEVTNTQEGLVSLTVRRNAASPIAALAGLKNFRIIKHLAAASGDHTGWIHPYDAQIPGTILGLNNETASYPMINVVNTESGYTINDVVVKGKRYVYDLQVCNAVNNWFTLAQEPVQILQSISYTGFDFHHSLINIRTGAGDFTIDNQGPGAASSRRQSAGEVSFTVAASLPSRDGEGMQRLRDAFVQAGREQWFDTYFRQNNISFSALLCVEIIRLDVFSGERHSYGAWNLTGEVGDSGPDMKGLIFTDKRSLRERYGIPDNIRSRTYIYEVHYYIAKGEQSFINAPTYGIDPETGQLRAQQQSIIDALGAHVPMDHGQLNQAGSRVSFIPGPEGFWPTGVVDYVTVPASILRNLSTGALFTGEPRVWGYNDIEHARESNGNGTVTIDVQLDQSSPLLDDIYGFDLFAVVESNRAPPPGADPNATDQASIRPVLIPPHIYRHTWEATRPNREFTGRVRFGLQWRAIWCMVRNYLPGQGGHNDTALQMRVVAKNRYGGIIDVIQTQSVLLTAYDDHDEDALAAAAEEAEGAGRDNTPAGDGQNGTPNAAGGNDNDPENEEVDDNSEEDDMWE